VTVTPSLSEEEFVAWERRECESCLQLLAATARDREQGTEPALEMDLGDEDEEHAALASAPHPSSSEVVVGDLLMSPHRLLPAPLLGQWAVARTRMEISLSLSEL